METKIVDITPEMANAWLEKNMPNNRRLNTANIRKYARIMHAGGWELTHQGIAFDTDGNLIDGQHRLSAIVMANVPVTMMVTTGVKHVPGEALNIDVGARRTLTNIMQISGIEDRVYRNMGKVVVAFWRWKRPGGYRPDPTEVISYIDRHYDDMAMLNEIISENGHAHAKGRGINGFVGAGLLCALYRGEQPDALRKFVEVYRYNDVSGCEGYNARHALNLRDWVRDHRESAEGFARVESAICAFCHNKSQLYVKDNHYPYHGEMDA